jgi:hypothetical protein
MKGNRVRETTATTGTVSFTTSGAVAGFLSFYIKFGLNFPFTYWAINDTDEEWETAIGYLSASTTLVRQTITGNSAGTLVAINFTTAPSLFSDENEDLGRWPLTQPAISANDQILLSSHHVSYATAYIERATQMWVAPYINDFDGLVSKWALYVKTASAGAVARLAVYLVDEATGLATGDPWMESDDIDCGSTGLVTLNFTNNVAGRAVATRLPRYFYYAMAFEDSTIQTMAADYTDQQKTWLPKNANSAEPSIFQNFTMGTPTPGASIMPTISSVAMRNESYPIGGFQK